MVDVVCGAGLVVLKRVFVVAFLVEDSVVGLVIII